MATTFSFLPSFVAVTPQLLTSGQPAPDDFAQLAEGGVETIINLAAPGGTNYNPDEAQLVLDAGMCYVHIPVPWQAPAREDFDAFLAILNANKNRTVLVHCAMNMRVSAFIYLWQTRFQGEDETLARARMEQIWTPNETWQHFIDGVSKI